VNMKGVVLSFARAIVQMIRGMTFPSSYIASCFARDLSDESLTDSRRLPFTRSWNDKSSIIRYFRDLCGTAASGDIFRFLGNLCLMSSQFTNRHDPSFTRSKASFLQASAASGMLALACAPFLIAASSCSSVQSSPQSTGQPSSAYCNKMGPAGWSSISLRGYIKPLKGGNLLCSGVKSPTLVVGWGRGRGGDRHRGVRNGVSGRHGCRVGGDVVGGATLGVILIVVKMVNMAKNEINIDLVFIRG
jgi:hypothetical protein